MDGETLREGIYALNTRRFGSVAEVLIQKLAKLGKAQSQFHDLYDDLANRRVEVKFSRALKKSAIPVSERTVLQCIEAATSEKRLVSWSERTVVTYDCNIQQVKRTEFDELYYGIFFSDCVVIFHIESREIDSTISYSDFQHGPNRRSEGEGQFHINDRTFHIHEQRHLYKKLTYDDLAILLS